MHLPLLHISDRSMKQPPLDDPFGIGRVEGKDWIPWLADPVDALARVRYRTKTGDYASLLAAAVGSEVMYFALLGGLFSAYDRRKALSLAGVVLPSVFVNQLFKARFKFKRPPFPARHPLAFVAPGDFTFPSGHAQNAVLLGLFLALRSRKRWVQVLGLSMAYTIPLSRVYLGVHYPRDILAGALLGIGTLVASMYVEEPFTCWWLDAPPGSRSMTVATAAAIVGVLSGTPLAAFPLGVSGGLAIGHDLSGQKRFDIDFPRGRDRWIQGAVGMVMTFGVGFSVRPLLKRQSTMAGLIAGGLVGVGLTWGVPVFTDIVHRVGLLRKRLRRRRRSRRLQQIEKRNC